MCIRDSPGADQAAVVRLPVLNGVEVEPVVLAGLPEGEMCIRDSDAGVPVLSMHAPFETVGKLDCYMTYKGIKAFYEK